ncbi:TPA: DUF3800 domain-containing protein [Clostridioides difficile]|nr:DUF3800 domain-containing protein [Clostridioides difficile]
MLSSYVKRVSKIIKKKYIMFIDESGRADINHEDPFTLTGVIFEYKYAVSQGDYVCSLRKEMDAFKEYCFGTSNIGIHLTDISRKSRAFEKFDDSQIKLFYDELPLFLSRLECTIISVTVDKARLKKYYAPLKEPYVVAFIHVLQNFYSFVNNETVESARIVIESRDDVSNLKVQKAFFDVFNNGTIYLDIDEELRDKVKGFIIAKKEDADYREGLEIADILCNPLSRARRGLIEANPKCMQYGEKNKIFKSVRNKIYTPTSVNDIRNWGFKEVPIVEPVGPWLEKMR